MSLFLHLSIHLFFAVLAGYIVWRIWKCPKISFAAGIIGGFLIDTDHLIDYVLAFGTDFRLYYFLSGYQFLKSEKIYIIFHGWEYVLLFSIVALLIKRPILKSLFLALALGMFFHLDADVVIDHIPPQTYSVLYRVKHHFDVQALVYPEDYARHVEVRKQTGW